MRTMTPLTERLEGIEAIVFDLGNTLVPFAEPEVRVLYAQLEHAFRAELGPETDFYARANRIRNEMIREREANSMREITIEEFCEAVCGRPASQELIVAAHRTMHQTFVEVCRPPEGLGALLERLGDRFRLAVLSNYVLTRPVEDVLRRAGLYEHFDIVEVSAAHGYAKPHPDLFERVRSSLGTRPGATLMVGDNFYCDVVGGHRAGWRTAHTLEHYRGARSDPRAPDVRPDLVLERLDELAAGP